MRGGKRTCVAGGRSDRAGEWAHEGVGVRMGAHVRMCVYVRRYVMLVRGEGGKSPRMYIYGLALIPTKNNPPEGEHFVHLVAERSEVLTLTT